MLIPLRAEERELCSYCGSGTTIVSGAYWASWHAETPIIAYVMPMYCADTRSIMSFTRDGDTVILEENSEKATFAKLRSNG